MCRDVFSVHWVPKRLYTDNGPQFVAAEFRNFALYWDFEHTTSSNVLKAIYPQCIYPQSNEFIERMVGVIKPTFKKTNQTGTDPQLALFCLSKGRPLDSALPSPAQLLYGRPIR